MVWMLLYPFTWGAAFHQFYLADPTKNDTPILSLADLPWPAGAWPPSPPSEDYFQAALAEQGCKPVAIVDRRLEGERLGAPRFYPRVGWAIEWQLTYTCCVVGLDGPHTVYADRTALLLVPWRAP